MLRNTTQEKEQNFMEVYIEPLVLILALRQVKIILEHFSKEYIGRSTIHDVLNVKKYDPKTPKSILNQLKLEGIGLQGWKNVPPSYTFHDDFLKRHQEYLEIEITDAKRNNIRIKKFSKWKASV